MMWLAAPILRRLSAESVSEMLDSTHLTSASLEGCLIHCLQFVLKDPYFPIDSTGFSSGFYRHGPISRCPVCLSMSDGSRVNGQYCSVCIYCLPDRSMAVQHWLAIQPIDLLIKEFLQSHNDWNTLWARPDSQGEWETLIQRIHSEIVKRLQMLPSCRRCLCCKELLVQSCQRYLCKELLVQSSKEQVCFRCQRKSIVAVGWYSNRVAKKPTSSLAMVDSFLLTEILQLI